MTRGRGDIDREIIERALERIRTALRLNGSDIDLVQSENNSVKVFLRGRVVESFGSVMLLRIGIERALRTEVPGFGDVLTELQQEESTGTGLLINL